MGNVLLLGPEVLENWSFEIGSMGAWFDMDSPAIASLYVTDDFPYHGEYQCWFETYSSASLEYKLGQQGFTIPSSGEGYMLTAAISPDDGEDMRVALLSYNEATNWGLDDTFTPVTTGTPNWHLYSWKFAVTGQGSGSLIFYPGSYYQYTTLFDAISLRRYAQLNPSYAMRTSDVVMNRHWRRSFDGYLYEVNAPGQTTRWEVPVTWVSSSDRAAINSWWMTGANLRFLLDDSYPASYHNVRLVGETWPLPRYQYAHHGEYFEGKLILEKL